MGRKKKRQKRPVQHPFRKVREPDPRQALRECFRRLVAAGAFTPSPAPAALPRGEFQITVATSPCVEGGLAADLRLVRAALLYADGVKLCSLTSNALISLLYIGQMSTIERLGFLAAVAPSVSSDPNAQEAIHMLTGLQALPELQRLLPREHRTMLRETERHLSRSWREMEDTAYQQAEEMGLPYLLRAMDKGLVEVHVFKHQGDSEQLIQEYLGTLLGMLSDPSSYPLFDEAAGNLVRLSIQEGHATVTDPQAARGKHSGLAADLLGRLPDFSDATMDEVLDIRDRLDPYLRKFRGALSRFSEKIKGAAWDEDFLMEAEAIYHGEVAPAVQAIEEAAAENSILAAVGRGIAKPGEILKAGGVLGFVLAQSGVVPQLAAAGIGGGFGLTHAILSDLQERNCAIEGNELFFYYKAGRLLDS
jgi:hypothetical protein